MVEKRNCNFCGNEIEPGTGRMYVRVDGSVFFFDRHKCYSNFVRLRRIPREVRWTLSNPTAAKWKDREKKRRKGGRRYMPARPSSRRATEAQAEEQTPPENTEEATEPVKEAETGKQA
ncbi:MAG: 50S ribosomal protein L24e [Methanomassiliicoccales archaeon]